MGDRGTLLPALFTMLLALVVGTKENRPNKTVQLSVLTSDTRTHNEYSGKVADLPEVATTLEPRHLHQSSFMQAGDQVSSMQSYYNTSQDHSMTMRSSPYGGKSKTSPNITLSVDTSRKVTTTNKPSLLLLLHVGRPKPSHTVRAAPFRSGQNHVGRSLPFYTFKAAKATPWHVTRRSKAELSNIGNSSFYFYFVLSFLSYFFYINENILSLSSAR